MANAVLVNPKAAPKRRRRRNPPVIAAKPVRRRRRRNPRRMTDRGKRAVTVLGGAAGGLAHEYFPDLPFVDEDLIILALSALLAFTTKGAIAEGATGSAAYAAGAMARRVAGGGLESLFGGTEGLYKTGYLSTVPTARIPHTAGGFPIPGGFMPGSARGPANAGRAHLIAQMTREAVTAGLYEDEY